MITVEPPLTDTSFKRTPPISGHKTAVPAISLLKLYIYKDERVYISVRKEQTVEGALVSGVLNFTIADQNRWLPLAKVTCYRQPNSLVVNHKSQTPFYWIKRISLYNLYGHFDRLKNWAEPYISHSSDCLIKFKNIFFSGPTNTDHFTVIIILRIFNRSATLFLEI